LLLKDGRGHSLAASSPLVIFLSLPEMSGQ
jgi:hypothetical protein